MDREALRKAQRASRSAFLRREAQRQEKAAAVVLREKLQELEQGLLPDSVTEAELLLQRGREVQVAGGLLSAAQHRQALSGESVEATATADTDPLVDETRQESSLVTAAELPGSVALAKALPTTHTAAVGTSSGSVGGRDEGTAHVGATWTKTAAQDGGFVPLPQADIEARIAAKDFVAEKSFEELQEEKVATLQGRHAQLQEKRRALPIYQSRTELVRLIRANRVVVIVGETGSGKTTQLLQYLYEDGLHLPMPASSQTHTGGSSGAGSDDTRGDGVVAEMSGQDELRLICTQPRRLAAVSVAERVAQELGSRCGSVVGYKVRFDDRSGPLTRILFVTDGMMLKEFSADPDLQTVAAIMVDEAHERSINTDILLGLLRDVLRRNDTLKVIVASATINARRFSDFFDQAPVFTVQGRTFPVDTYYADVPVADYITESAQTVIGLHLSKPLPGDILVFLPGQDSIEACAETLRQYIVEAGAGQLRPLLILPVYSALPPQEQQRIYERTPPGTRKVVIATNIAETSITIDGVVYVVDCGLCKQDFYNPRAMVEELRVVPTSQASATQRAGRAGRTQRGECYRLYTAYTFHNELPSETIPEVMRCSMSTVVLQLKALGVDNLLHFDFLDPPSTESLERALDHLYLLGAMRQDGRLTTTGRRMAEFPLEPSLSRCLIKACALGCGRHMAMAAAMLTADSIFLNTRSPQEKAQIASAKERLFGTSNGDVVGYVNVLERWLRAGARAGEFCRAHFIHPRTLLRARDVLDQLLKTYDRIGLDLTDTTDKLASAIVHDDTEHGNKLDTSGGGVAVVNEEALTRALLSGFFFNVAKLELDKRSYRIVHPLDLGGGSVAGRMGVYDPRQQQLLANDEEAPVAELHPTSALFRLGQKGGVAEAAATRERPSLVVFTQLRRTTKRFMMHVTAIASVDWVLESAPENYFCKEELETKLRKRTRN